MERVFLTAAPRSLGYPHVQGGTTWVAERGRAAAERQRVGSSGGAGNGGAAAVCGHLREENGAERAFDVRTGREQEGGKAGCEGEF